ncbi:hypothetical protein ElyMa_000320600 [Elysia marginata]|uniref:Reverse transcriptase domain-containing protein n=1 Tax=Elysia marginata TaxID=1093978 RepID=A0AAV4FA62_9GAST|nr:hypothetical protein ElyMa_000320600 [Elysia marginata]
MLFACDAALAMHSEKTLQRLISRFADACSEFSLEGVDKFVYLGSTISNKCSESRAKLWDRHRGSSIKGSVGQRGVDTSLNPKIRVYQACVLSMPVYGSETWALRSQSKY